MMEAIRLDISATARWTGLSTFSDRVMEAMEIVPRHVFIDNLEPNYAYANRPAPIGHGQTISQPYIVALMTELLALAPEDRVLEIGTGCGYQTAVLAEVAKYVVSIETIDTLCRTAKQRLDQLGYGQKTKLHHGDGFDGWQAEAPYDAVIVTAAPDRIPEQLVAQLRPGGRMVIPVGPPHGSQMLYRVIRRTDGGYDKTGILPVAFVPLLPQNDGSENKDKF